MVKEKEKESIIIIMEIDMKEIGKIVSKKEKEFIIIIVEIDMKVIGKIILKKGKVFIIGKMEKNMKEREFIIIIMVIDMKVNLDLVKRMEEELCIIIMVTERWAIILMMIQLESM